MDGGMAAAIRANATALPKESGAITSLIKGRLLPGASWEAPRSVGKRKGLRKSQSQVKSCQVKSAQKHRGEPGTTDRHTKLAHGKPHKVGRASTGA